MNKKDLTTAMTRASGVLDQSKFRSRFFWALLAHPWTLWPLLLGLTDLMALWTFSIPSPAALFAGIVSILGSVGILLTRLLMGSEGIARNILEEMETEAITERERALDSLDQRLSADGDSRTEKSLRDLRALARAFQDDQSWLSTLNIKSTFDILSGVEQLFSRCVLSLEKSLKLWYTAREMTTDKARQPILDQRERIITDVAESIHQLGRILAGIQRIGVHEGEENSELARIRQELDRSLQVAEIVEQRMQSIDQELNEDYSPD